MNLLELSCEAQHGASPLAASTINQLMGALPGWSIRGIELTKTFPSPTSTTPWPSSTRWPGSLTAKTITHLSVHYNRAVVNFSTHDAGGLTLNDFICAAKTEALLARP